MDHDNATLTIRDVVKTYPNGVRAVDGISLEVARGEVKVLLGPSGCGKSTLLRCVNGLEGISEGSVSLDGDVLNRPGMKHTRADARVGMVFQSYDLFAHLNVLDNLVLAPTVAQRRARGAAIEQARGLLERVGLADRQRDFPRQLSGGQQQRVAIVRALMTNPDILLLDEITASLDPEMVREVLDVIIELADGGMTMLMVTHELAFARAIADEIVFLDDGAIIERSPAHRFFSDPQTERARRFLHNFEFEDIRRNRG